MNFARVSAIFVRQLFLFKSNPTRLASIFLWIFIDILQWGFISKYLGSLGQQTFSFITVILGAIILWDFMSRMQQGIMMSFLEDIWSQNFINFFASPLKLKEYLSGLIATSLLTGFAGFLVMIGMAQLIFRFNVFKIGWLLAAFMCILLIFGIAMGIFVSAMIFRLGPSAEWLGWPIPLVLSLFAGVYYPVATLPPALRIISYVLPPSYAFESIRAILTSGASTHYLLFNLTTGTLLSVLYLIITCLIFIHVYRRNLQNGSIARFNAESL